MLKQVKISDNMKFSAEIFPYEVDLTSTTVSVSFKCALKNKPGCVVSADSKSFKCGECAFAIRSYNNVVQRVSGEGFVYEQNLRRKVTDLGPRSMRKHINKGRLGLRYSAWRRHNPRPQYFSMSIFNSLIIVSQNVHQDGEPT